MALQKITLGAAAKTLRVHPRTICRALTGRHNTYWYEDSNHDRYDVQEIADAYQMNPDAFRRCIEGRDKLIKAAEACVILGIKPRTFRDRLMASAAPHIEYGRVGNGGIVRYLNSKIIEAKKIGRAHG